MSTDTVLLHELDFHFETTKLCSKNTLYLDLLTAQSTWPTGVKSE